MVTGEVVNWLNQSSSPIEPETSHQSDPVTQTKG